MSRTLLPLLCLILTLFPSAALAGEVGRIVRSEGRVDLLRSGAGAVVPAPAGTGLQLGDVVRTKSDGRAEIVLSDGSTFSLAPKSRLRIESYLFRAETSDRSVSVRLHRGQMGFQVEKLPASPSANRFEMKTRTAVAGVRGTAGLLFSGAVERLLVREGAVEFSGPRGSALVGAGYQGEIVSGRPVLRPFSQEEFRRLEREPASAAMPETPAAAPGGEPLVATPLPTIPAPLPDRFTGRDPLPITEIAPADSTDVGVNVVFPR